MGDLCKSCFMLDVSEHKDVCLYAKSDVVTILSATCIVSVRFCYTWPNIFCSCQGSVTSV